MRKINKIVMKEDYEKNDSLMPGRKFVPGRNWGGKAVDEKTLSFYYLFIQHIKNCTTRLV